MAKVGAWRDEHLEEARNVPDSVGTQSTKALRKRLLAARTRETEGRAAKLASDRIPLAAVEKIFAGWESTLNKSLTEWVSYLPELKEPVGGLVQKMKELSAELLASITPERGVKLSEQNVKRGADGRHNVV